MAHVRVVGYATIAVNLEDMNLPTDPDLGYAATELMVKDCASAVGGKLIKHHYAADTMTLYITFEDRRDALYIAFHFRTAMDLYREYWEDAPPWQPEP